MEGLAYEYGHRGLLAYNAGQLDHAVMFLSLGIQQTPSSEPVLASKLLEHRADCYWDCGQKDEACNDMKKALDLFPGFKGDSGKWISRGHVAMEEENFSVATWCFSFALLFSEDNLSIHALLYVWRAEANYRMGKTAEARNDIARCRKVDSSLLKQNGQRFKDSAIQMYQMRSYKKAIDLFGLALEFLPCSMKELHAQVHSYLASCYFSLQQYAKALQAGKEAYKFRPGRSQGEARRWKERGKQLFKESRFDLLVDYYSMAINYAPGSDRELLAQLLCNRSLVHLKNKTFKLALLDAERCVKIWPNWSKGHYRLGSSFFVMKRYEDAMDSFTVALDLAETDDEKYDSLSQIITVGLELEYGTSMVGESACLTEAIIQRAVDDAVTKKDWERLRVLFLGGGGPTEAFYGEGGIGSECDTSRVPLGLVIASKVSDKTNLISALVRNGACVRGLSEGEKPPLLVALEMEDYLTATVLLDEGADVSCALHVPHLQTKSQAMFWKKQAIATFCRGEDDTKASLLFNLALQCAPTQATNLKWECLDFLSDIHFKRKEYAQCVEYGVKGFGLKPARNEASARKWRERGNQLFKEKVYNMVIDYYSLAMDYVPHAVESELMGVLLSNRCAAYLNLSIYDKAMADARECVHRRPDWSKVQV